MDDSLPIAWSFAFLTPENRIFVSRPDDDAEVEEGDPYHRLLLRHAWPRGDLPLVLAKGRSVIARFQPDRGHR